MTQVPRSPSVKPHIVFDGIGKVYREKGREVRALSSVSFTVQYGEIFGIIGRSGAGKSTLLRTINALETPSEGHVLIHGVNPALLDENQLVQQRRKIGMIFQHFNLLSAKTVFDNVALPLKVAGMKPGVIRERVHELLNLVGLTDKADTYPAQLSGGQKQRVGIARALVHSPEILLCDEATSALDPETTESILNLLRTINRQLEITIVLITHDMAVIRNLCDRVLVLDRGEIQELGPVWEIFGAPAAETTQALLQPLQHTVPPEVAEQLRPVPASPLDQAIISLGFSGAHHPQGISLQALQSVSNAARWIHGGLERLGGHSFGRVLVSVPASSLPSQEQILAASGANFMEILGYVSSS